MNNPGSSYISKKIIKLIIIQSNLQLFFDIQRIYIWRTKMKQIKEQINRKSLLGTPPFFREFKIDPFIY